MDAVGVKFVKTDDKAFMRDLGINKFPTIIYFEKESPSIYEGKSLTEFVSLHYQAFFFFSEKLGSMKYFFPLLTIVKQGLGFENGLIYFIRISKD